MGNSNGFAFRRMDRLAFRGIDSGTKAGTQELHETQSHGRPACLMIVRVHHDNDDR